MFDFICYYIVSIISYIEYLLRLWLFFLSSEEGIKSDISDMDNFESDSGKISDGMSFSSKTSNKDTIIFIDEF